MHLVDDKLYLEQILREFFADYNASLLGIQEQKRDNFERFPAPGDGILRCFTVSILCHNIGIFGRTRTYLEGAYPRLAMLHQKLAEWFRERGVNISGAQAEISFTIIPYPDPKGTFEGELEALERYSKGQTIIAGSILAEKSAYYAHLIQKYGDCVGVVTNNGTVIGPDGGLLTAASGVAATYQEKIRVVELGSGGGSSALVLARQQKLQSYHGNDFSAEMVEHFQNNVVPYLDARQIESSIFQGSCFDFPLKGPADLILVGVYYQAQPSLFAACGHELIQCLDTSGVVIIQSGMLEDTFTTQLLSGVVQSMSWPWYQEGYHLSTYFHYIAEYIVEQETVLIATNDATKFQQVSAALAQDCEFQRITTRA
jgi:hypothetical protein